MLVRHSEIVRLNSALQRAKTSCCGGEGDNERMRVSLVTLQPLFVKVLTNILQLFIIRLHIMVISSVLNLQKQG